MFPNRNLWAALALALGIFTANNYGSYHEAIIAIQDQCDRVVSAAHIPHPVHGLEACERFVLLQPAPYVQGTQQPAPLVQQTHQPAPLVQQTQQPATPGEDSTAAQLLPQYRQVVDKERFVEKEAIAILGAVLIAVSKSGLDMMLRARRRQRQGRKGQDGRRGLVKLRRPAWRAYRRRVSRMRRK
jgi:hypothetical protein